MSGSTCNVDNLFLIICDLVWDVNLSRVGNISSKSHCAWRQLTKLVIAPAPQLLLYVLFLLTLINVIPKWLKRVSFFNAESIDPDVLIEILNISTCDVLLDGCFWHKLESDSIQELFDILRIPFLNWFYTLLAYYNEMAETWPNHSHVLNLFIQITSWVFRLKVNMVQMVALG